MEPEKKTTVLDASVGADAGQPFQCNNTNITETTEDRNYDFEDNEEYMKKLQRLQDPTILNTITYNDLMDEVLPYRRVVIEGMMSTGAYLLAGAPKIGKSFLVAQIAYHVSTGKELWGNVVHGGTVLYLALEDDKKRLQERMARMFGVEGTDRLHFATEAGLVGQGLDKQLDNFIREHPDTTLIIIDTLQKIREVAGEGYSYSNDYEVIGKFKQVSDSYNLCILIVHHTRKQQSGDKYEKISGTNGLLGAADGAIVMEKEKRSSGTANLELTGRDHPPQILYLNKNQETLIWELDHAETEVWKDPPDPILEKIKSIVTIETPYWEGTPTELAELLEVDIAPNHLSRRLNVSSGRLRAEAHICYTRVKTHASRIIQLTYYVEEPITTN